jgi:hypothetical protein
MNKAITKEERTVNRTTDYNIFKLLNANRPVTETHVNGIIKSIEDNGSWLENEPVLVNEGMEVIDGQHRLEAHKRLELPVYYIVVDGLGMDRAHAMNRARRNWTLEDWMYSYDNSGNINYKRFVKLYDDNEQFPIGVIVSACSDKPLKSNLTKDFRTGELSLSEEEAKQAQKRLDMLAEMSGIAPHFVLGPTCRFILQMITHPKYDHERMVKKMKEVGGDTFVPSAYIGTVLAQLERAYNRKVELSNMVRFL